jgi:predicted glycosyltransferase
MEREQRRTGSGHPPLGVVTVVGRYLFFSHDGYGLGHVRRNSVIARALARSEPNASVTIVTGVPKMPAWLERWGQDIVRVPPLLKNGHGRYRPLGTSFEEAVARRAAIFLETVDRVRPHVVVVDRHPFGTAGELREGLELAACQGSASVLGLRDILDDPSVIADEMKGRDWAEVPDVFEEVLVYGARRFCDHQEEYGLPVRPTYCGWVVKAPVARVREPRLLAAAAGGGADGEAVFRLATQALHRRPDWRGEFVTGPFGDADAVGRAARSMDGRVKLHLGMSECGALYARAGAVVQMGGYNSTFDALIAGDRPVLVPRRHPRQEQAIRAERLALLGLADVVESDASPEDLMRVLRQPRSVRAATIARSGIDMRGADRAAVRIRRLADQVGVG